MLLFYCPGLPRKPGSDTHATEVGKLFFKLLNFTIFDCFSLILGSITLGDPITDTKHPSSLILKHMQIDDVTRVAPATW